jgi:hypothetical protein
MSFNFKLPALNFILQFEYKFCFPKINFADRMDFADRTDGLVITFSILNFIKRTGEFLMFEPEYIYFHVLPTYFDTRRQKVLQLEITLTG